MAGEPVRYRSIVYDSSRWDGFEFREGDIVISTPPKCGTTWTQMICALLIFQTTAFDRTLDHISPWLDMLLRPLDDVVAELDAQQHQRFIKTHTPFDGLPHDPRVTYVCVGRDPRDVAMSWDNHMANIDIERFLTEREAAVGLEDLADPELDDHAPLVGSELERFWQWVDQPLPMSLAATVHHISTFWERRDRDDVVLLHYATLEADLDGQMRHLATRLGITVPEDRWTELVTAATFASMRSRADELVPNRTSRIWQNNERFFHRGTSGQWRTLLDENGRARYAARVDELASPELSAWLHQGPLGP